MANASATAQAIASTTAHAANSADLIITSVVAGINALGIVANSALLLAIALQRKSGRLLGAAGLTLMQQAAVDLLTCAVSVELNWNQLSWLPSGAPWLAAFVCYVWHSQTVFWMLYELSVYNHVILAGERCVAVLWPLRADRLNDIVYRVCLVTVWVVYCVGVQAPSFWYTIYDASANSCEATDYSGEHQWLRWYGIGLSMTEYPVPLLLEALLNGATVWHLSRERRHQSVTLHAKASSGDVKQRASLQLIRTSIALALLFLITSAFSQITYTYQNIAGVYWGSDFVNLLALVLQALTFTGNPFVCFLFLPGLRRRILARVPVRFGTSTTQSM